MPLKLQLPPLLAPIFHSRARGTNTEGESPARVAQICNLLYRRFVIGSAPDFANVPFVTNAPQNAILRYSRLQICATKHDVGFQGSAQFTFVLFNACILLALSMC